jgi:uncharacterized protein YjbI with pentapeptide repeats
MILSAARFEGADLSYANLLDAHLTRASLMDKASWQERLLRRHFRSVAL